jgi:hypothetical protein
MEVVGPDELISLQGYCQCSRCTSRELFAFFIPRETSQCLYSDTWTQDCIDRAREAKANGKPPIALYAKRSNYAILWCVTGAFIAVLFYDHYEENIVQFTKWLLDV